MEQSEGYEEAQQRAREITDTLNMEAMASVRVAYGTIVQEIKAVPRSYQEAQVALEIGRVFYAERGILAYGELGIGRLIHQLPKVSLRNVSQGKCSAAGQQTVLKKS